jgi:hypothetical protein
MCRPARRHWLALIAALAAVHAMASEANMRSPACREALAALQARESAMAAAAASQPSAQPDRRPLGVADRQWQALRARAAQTCLGGEPDAPASHSALPPITVPPVVIAPTAPRAPTAMPAAPIIEPRKPPTTVTGCDPGGCWANDGSRLPHVGRNPLDPTVHCTVQGSLVVCL